MNLLVRKATLAILRIPRLNIRVPVLEGTDEFARSRRRLDSRHGTAR
jgi:hypothetical protein